MITWQVIVVFLTILFILISLYKGLAGVSFTFVVAITFLGLIGILTPSEILSGFANDQVAIIIMLLLISDLLRKSGTIEILFDKMFKSAKTERGFMMRMSLIISAFSSFLNNTPVVAVMMPYINTWCKRNHIAPSKFLMPLSYATIIGGCATLIGTSTNLIVNGMVKEQTVFESLKSLSIFDFAYVGVPMIFIGTAYLMYVAPRILKSNDLQIDDNVKKHRNYLVEAVVKSNSHLKGMSISEAGFINNPRLQLLELIRKDNRFQTLDNDILLEDGDVLLFSGDSNDIAKLLKANSGLILPTIGILNKMKKTQLAEVVVSDNSEISYKKIKEINFRAMYGAAILSIYRNGELMDSPIGEYSLKPGDVLLLFGSDEFNKKSLQSRDFYLLSGGVRFEKLEDYKTLALFIGLVLAVFLSAFKIISLFLATVILIIMALILKISNPKELPKGIDYDLGLTIVMSLALGIAMQKTGAAHLISTGIIGFLQPMGLIVLMFGLYMITTLLAAYITSKAAVAIIFPIILNIAKDMHLEPKMLILIMAYAAAANFMTPIGYQTNLMVYGPGKYKFNDYMKLGFPLTILYMITSVFILYFLYAY